MKAVGCYTVQTDQLVLDHGNVVKGFLTNNPSEEYAVKILDLAKMSQPMFISLECELVALKAVNSYYVVRLVDTLKTAHRIYIFMELCQGGTLEEFLQKYGTPREDLAQRWLWNIANALYDLRKCNITHRNLKLENIVLTHTDPDLAVAKLADFGFARYATATTLMQSCRETTVFTAPEVLAGGEYNYKVDVWSYGVLAYFVLVGQRIYPGISSQRELIQAQRQEVQFPTQCQLSPTSKDFIQWLLSYDPTSRPSFDEVQSHSFFTTPLRHTITELAQAAPSQDEREWEQCNEEVLKANSYCAQTLPLFGKLAIKYIEQGKNLIGLAIAQVCKSALEEIKRTLDIGRNRFPVTTTGEEVYQDVVAQITCINDFIQTDVKLTMEDLARSVTKRREEGVWVDGRLLVEESARLEAETAQTDPRTQLKSLEVIDLLMNLAGNAATETEQAQSLLKRVAKKREELESAIYNPE